MRALAERPCRDALNRQRRLFHPLRNLRLHLAPEPPPDIPVTQATALDRALESAQVEPDTAEVEAAAPRDSPTSRSHLLPRQKRRLRAFLASGTDELPELEAEAVRAATLPAETETW